MKRKIQLKRTCQNSKIVNNQMSASNVKFSRIARVCSEAAAIE